VRDGEKGPVAIEMVTRRVQRGWSETHRTRRMVVDHRRPLTDERTLEARASRDAYRSHARYLIITI